jgi:hypothetical protein
VTSPRPRLAGVVLAIGVAVHVLFVASLFAGLLDPLFDDAVHRFGQGADYYALHQAAQNVRDRVSVYDAPATWVVPYCYPYRYLPFTALTLGQVLVLLPARAGYAAWVVAIEAMLVANLLLTRRLFVDVGRRRIAMAMWLLFAPYALELHMGQFSFAMATLTFWAIALWADGATRGGDVLWTTSLLVKTNSALFVPVLVKLRRWKAAAVAVGVVALVSAPYFARVPGSFAQFSRNYAEGLAVETIPGNQGFAALIACALLRWTGRWGTDLAATTRAVATPLAVWTVAVLVATAWITFLASARRATELFVLWLLAYFLLYKHVWEHQYVMLLPAFVLAFRSTTRDDGVRLRRGVLWTAFAVCALPTAFVAIDHAGPQDPEWVWSTGEALLFHAPKPLAVLALYVALAVALVRDRDEPTAR